MLDRFAFLRSALRNARCRAVFAYASARRRWRDPVRRERILAPAAFALIAAFTLGTLDYLIAGGGPDWNPGGVAYAMEPPRAYVAPPPPSLLDDAAPPALDAVSEAVDYSVTSEVLLGGPETFASVERAPVPFSYALETRASLADFGLPPSGMGWR